MSFLVENSLSTFLVVTVLLGGGAAWMAGRALALGWRPVWLVLAYMVPLGMAVRFFHYALGGGSLLSIHHFMVDTVILAAIAVLSHRVAQTRLMVRQYPWLYRQTSPVSWTAIE